MFLGCFHGGHCGFPLGYKHALPSQGTPDESIGRALPSNPEPTRIVFLTSPLLNPTAAPTLQLLHAIADSPAPHPNGDPGKPSKPGKPGVHSQVSVTSCKVQPCVEPTRGKREKDGKTTAKPTRAGGERSPSQTYGARKRPRSFPGSTDSSKGRRNPFDAYKLPRPPRSPFLRNRNNVDERFAKGSASGGAVDMSKDSDDDDFDFPTKRTAFDRGLREGEKTPKKGDGQGSSPYMVDLSTMEDDEPSVGGVGEGGGFEEQGFLHGFSMEARETSFSQESCDGGDTSKWDEKTPSSTLSPGCVEDGASKGDKKTPFSTLSPGYAGGDTSKGHVQTLFSSGLSPGCVEGGTSKGDDGTWSSMLSPGCDHDRDQSGKSGVEVEGQGDKESEEGEGNVEDEVEWDILLASKLSFLVSGNTGRVHVYQEQGDDGDGLDDSFGEEDRRPLHCRFEPFFSNDVLS